MKVSINWLKELVDLKVSNDELVRLLPLRTIGTKEVSDNFIELDMKGYNRADLLSLRGVAYEVGAITDSNIKFQEADIQEKDLKIDLPDLDVVIESTFSAFYCLAKIENLKVEQSNDSWVKKLSDSGFRSVNNIADVTNLVMLEYGQPLHAFDASTVDQEKVIVRTAKKGEVIKTLDDKERILDESDLLITDPKKAIGIAGVMGGKNTEIKSNTSTILLEAAIFDPVNLRKTASRLGLQSEASKRFYHGLTKKRLLQALAAAIKMYQELGGKLVGISIVGEYQDRQKTIDVSMDQINSLVGIDLDSTFVKDSLEKLNFEVTNISSNFSVKVPYFRLDVDIAQDVIEEVARLYGYEKIPAKQLIGDNPPLIDQKLFTLIRDTKSKLVALGLTEVQTYPYYSTLILESLGFSENSNLDILVSVANPISAETKYLRMNLWPNLVESTSKNLKYFSDVAIFEIGKVYIAKKDERPGEKYILSIALSNGGDNPLNELHKLTEQLSKELNLGLKLEKSDAISVDVENLFHPTRFLAINKEGKRIGGLAEVHPRVVNKIGSDKRIAILEMTL